MCYVVKLDFMAEAFLQFAESLLKTPLERRAREAPAKSVQLEELWFAVPSADKSEALRKRYGRCKIFLSKSLTDDSENSDNDDLGIFNEPQVNTENSLPGKSNDSSKCKMEFSLKTVNSVVPDFDGNSSQLVDFLDCAKLYNDMLSDAGKVIFLNFLLKVKLKKRAKVAVTSEITTFDDFDVFMRARFRPRVTLATLQNELTSLRQENSVTDFASKIEELVSKMTQLQVIDHGDNNLKIIKSLNDVVALNALKMGASAEIKRVLLAAQVKSFTDGVSVALEAESGIRSSFSSGADSSKQVSVVHRGRGGRGWNNRGSNRGYNRDNYRGRQNNYNSNKGYQQQSSSSQGQGTQDNRRGGKFQQRGPRFDDSQRGAFRGKNQSGNGKAPPTDGKQVQVSLAAIRSADATPSDWRA